MSADFFNDAVAVVLSHEGGFVDNPVDHGGPTNGGLTLHDLRLGGLPDDVETLKALTDDQKRGVYRQVFWAPNDFGEIDSREVAIVAFDQGILDGIPKVVAVLQHLVGAPVDGDLGPATLAAVNREDGHELAHRLLMARVEFYIGIVRSDPSQIEFLNGWMHRLLSLSYITA